jgi:predicted amidohydrolase YtcJ
MYNFNESKKLENNSNNIFERFEKVKLEIDQSVKNFEVKIAEMISNKKLNDEQKHDVQKLGTIIKQVDDNLINLKDMLK